MNTLSFLHLYSIILISNIKACLHYKTLPHIASANSEVKMYIALGSTNEATQKNEHMKQTSKKLALNEVEEIPC